MKRVIKKVSILLCLMALFMLPGVSTLAASNATLAFEDNEVKFYEFKPDPYKLYPGDLMFLDDVNYNLWWEVPAGKQFFFSTEITSYESFTITIIKEGVGVVYTGTQTGTFFTNNITAESSNARYRVVIIPITTPISVIKYTGCVYK